MDIWDFNGDWVANAWTDSEGDYLVIDLEDGIYFASAGNDIGYIDESIPTSIA